MNGKLEKYSWTIDPKGWVTVWIGTKEHYKTPDDGFVSFNPEALILDIIKRNEGFENLPCRLLVGNPFLQFPQLTTELLADADTLIS